MSAEPDSVDEKTPLSSVSPNISNIDSSLSPRMALTVLSICYTLSTLSAVTLCLGSSFLPLVATSLGVGTQALSYVYSASPFMTALASPCTGVLCARWGYMPILLFGGFMLAFSTFFFGCIPSLATGAVEVFTLFLVARGLQGVFVACLYSAMLTWLSQSFPSEVGRVVGQFETFQGVGSAFGSPIGATLYTVGGFICPFAVEAVLLLLAMGTLSALLYTRYIPAHRPIPKPEKGEPKAGNLRSILTPHVLAPCFATFIASVPFTGLGPLVPLVYSQRFDFSVLMISAAFASVSTSYAISGLLMGRLSDRVGPHKLIPVGLIFGGIALCLIGYPHPVVSVLAYILLSVSCAAVFVPVVPAVLTALPASSASLGVGTGESAYYAGEVVGPIAGESLAVFFGFQTGISLLGLGLITCGLGYALFSCQVVDHHRKRVAISPLPP
eukprot:NODE_517_length_1581_cov_345.869452_g394_i0.p1 GENE.NODE_517_length_1581_cov_345.869452_g394_i0~~NODE_517_length_1581_cov_345.869452_g394_i0.p1  ORF type:complete len:493 (-),score=91.80 NODE_517_length_1581_cov_345.869452_g394_i0:102-1424(-)